ncbi:hypothetical protein B9Z55_019742 [Caenorhabditis nigoni]|uniref:Uncharacterized protein n=1 Tax=Caenorhabditis nigoni TaxID=1611254 RepID=A0A2G5TKF9_9PELO|nr:hypothetical protein B9Z55_019742 [Caenorhabditis nigoni]
MLQAPSTLLTTNSAKSPTPMDADVINDQSLVTEVTTTRSTIRPTHKGNLENSTTSGRPHHHQYLYAIMDEQSRHQRQQLDEEVYR